MQTMAGGSASSARYIRYSEVPGGVLSFQGFAFVPSPLALVAGFAVPAGFAFALVATFVADRAFAFAVGIPTSPQASLARRYASRVNVAIAFGAGILSFLSPCVLPLVPAFLVNMAGEAALAGTQRRRTLVHAFAFVLGFSAVFTLLWVLVALVGALAGDLVFWLQRAGGLLLIVLGMHMLGLITIPLFALMLDLLLNQDLLSGATLLLAYALGLGVPFLVIAAGVGARQITAFLRRSIRVVNAVGLLLVSGQFARLPQLFNFLPLLG